MASAMRPPLSRSRDTTWASLAHFGNILGVIPPLLIFLILGPRGRFVRQESREALNFALTVLVAWLAVYALGTASNAVYQAMPAGIRLLFLLIGFVCTAALLAVWIAMVVFAIIAGRRVVDGVGYRYPVAIRFLK